MSKSDDLISRQAAIDAIEDTDWYHVAGGELVHGANSKEDEPLYKAKDIYSVIENLPSAQPEIKPIEYRDCANAMLEMWMDKVVTDGEYNRIMDKLNAHWAERREE